MEPVLGNEPREERVYMVSEYKDMERAGFGEFRGYGRARAEIGTKIEVRGAEAQQLARAQQIIRRKDPRQSFIDRLNYELESFMSVNDDQLTFGNMAVLSDHFPDAEMPLATAMPSSVEYDVYNNMSPFYVLAAYNCFKTIGGGVLVLSTKRFTQINQMIGRIVRVAADDEPRNCAPNLVAYCERIKSLNKEYVARRIVRFCDNLDGVIPIDKMHQVVRAFIMCVLMIFGATDTMDMSDEIHDFNDSMIDYFDLVYDINTGTAALTTEAASNYEPPKMKPVKIQFAPEMPLVRKSELLSGVYKSAQIIDEIRIKASVKVAELNEELARFQLIITTDK